MSKIVDIIARVDENRPNAFSSATKMKWISDLDGKIAADVFLMDIAQIRELEYRHPDGLEQEPLVTFPHDDIYDLWLEAKIDAANGEYNRYQNTMQLYNESYGNFVRWFASVYEPAQGEQDACFVPRSNVPSYYLTAYGIAVKRGFVGTVDEWLESLVGPQGLPGTDPVAIQQAVEAAVPSAVNAEVPGAVTKAVAAVLPNSVRNEVAAVLPNSVRNEVAAALPAEVDKQMKTALPEAVGEALKNLPEPEAETHATNKAYVDRGLRLRYPAQESDEHPGCYYRIVDGVTEWINPPVVLGVEYRTTERFSGMPVYTKFVQLGVTASGQSIVQWHDASVSPIRHACRFTSQTLPFLNDDNTILVNVRLVSNDAHILCNSNWVISSSSQIQMQVWYYK